MAADMWLMAAEWIFADRGQMEKLGLIADGNSILARLPMLRL
jgi:hypothetical protein